MFAIDCEQKMCALSVVLSTSPRPKDSERFDIRTHVRRLIKSKDDDDVVFAHSRTHATTTPNHIESIPTTPGQSEIEGPKIKPEPARVRL
jgi:hypothetical protein